MNYPLKISQNWLRKFFGLMVSNIKNSNSRTYFIRLISSCLYSQNNLYSFSSTHLSLDLDNMFALSSKRLIFKEIKAHTFGASSYWRANKLWEKYEKRLEHFDYKQNNLNNDFHVVIIGCSPVGLRLSIECALMGFKCTIIEKRDSSFIRRTCSF